MVIALFHCLFFSFPSPFVCLTLPSFCSNPLILSLPYYLLSHPPSPSRHNAAPILLFHQLTGGSSAQAFVSKHVEGINWLQRLALSTRMLLCGCHLALTLPRSLFFFNPALPLPPHRFFSFILPHPYVPLVLLMFSLPSPFLLSLCRAPLVRSSPLLRLKDSHVVSNETG